MEVWYYWLALAVIFYVAFRRRFEGKYWELFADIVAVLLLMTGLVELLNSGDNLAGLWLQIFGWGILARIAIFFFKEFMGDLWRQLEDAISGWFR